MIIRWGEFIIKVCPFQASIFQKAVNRVWGKNALQLRNIYRESSFAAFWKVKVTVGVTHVFKVKKCSMSCFS